MSSQSTSAFARLMASEAGPKTVHFWAPVMKWSLVIAGLKDLSRPVDKISGTQQFALMATGLIWTRWSWVIRPRNYLLASVNIFLGGVAGMQVARLYNWRRELGESSLDSLKYVVSGNPSDPPKTAKTAQPAN